MTQPRQRAELQSMTATVPRQLVHRAAVAETLLTGWSRIAADRFSVSAQWPRAHGLHVSPDRSAYDPLLVVETVRQSGTLIAHTEYEVPLDHHFVLQEFQVDTFPRHLAVGAVPAELTVEVTFVDVQYRGRRPVGAVYTAEVLRGGELVATARRVAFTCTSEPVYRRLRGGRTAAAVTPLPLPPALPPATVGRALPEDVVLAPATGRNLWQLRIDTAHPVFFDHPLDHVPGMLLLEAARQAVRAHTGGSRSPVSFRIAFHRYAELDAPVWIEATEGSGSDVQVIGRQGDSPVFVCAVGTWGR
jgi:hypothetical protein